MSQTKRFWGRGSGHRERIPSWTETRAAFPLAKVSSTGLLWKPYLSFSHPCSISGAAARGGRGGEGISRHTPAVLPLTIYVTSPVLGRRRLHSDPSAHSSGFVGDRHRLPHQQSGQRWRRVTVKELFEPPCLCTHGFNFKPWGCRFIHICFFLWLPLNIPL